MAQSFTAQVSAFCERTKKDMEAVWHESIQRTVEIAQEPGYSRATANAAIKRGAGLGKGGGHSRSMAAFGPIANPGGTGNLPVDTGFLRASVRVNLGEATDEVVFNPDRTKKYSYQVDAINLLIALATLRDKVSVLWAANYAAAVEYGTSKMPPRRFVGLAVQRWNQTVEETVVKLKARRTGL